MSSKTRRLVAELHAMLDQPDERELVEQIIVAELCAATKLRQVLPAVADARLVPPNIVERFRELQGITQETGPAWAARVDNVLRQALEALNPADDVLVALVRPAVLLQESSASSRR